MKEKYIISRWTFLCMPFEVYSAHVFNNSFGRVQFGGKMAKKYLRVEMEYPDGRHQ